LFIEGLEQPTSIRQGKGSEDSQPWNLGLGADAACTGIPLEPPENPFGFGKAGDTLGEGVEVKDLITVFEKTGGKILMHLPGEVPTD
jgi:hypothetical protein